MQISHAEIMLFLGKSIRLSSELPAPKSHLSAKTWSNDFIIKFGLK